MNTGTLDCVVENDWLKRPLEEADFELMHQGQEQTLMRRTEAPMESLMLFCSDAEATHEEYLTIKELAERLRNKPKTIRNKIANGIFKKDVHYFRPAGLGTRFKWSAIVKWMESEARDTGYKGIRMARGYILGQPEA
jgi:hypothetical protein